MSWTYNEAAELLGEVRTQKVPAVAARFQPLGDHGVDAVLLKP